jgi:hypothetical protein
VLVSTLPYGQLSARFGPLRDPRFQHAAYQGFAKEAACLLVRAVRFSPALESVSAGRSFREARQGKSLMAKS